jgi:hypothetical protein
LLLKFQWDYNWDKREPYSLLKPLKSGASEEETQNHQKKLESLKPKVTVPFLCILPYGCTGYPV